MAYFVADEKLQGYYVSGGVTINIIKYHFECDDAASLPAQTAFISSKKVKISMASTAHTIDTDALYKMDSSGAWVQQSQPWQPLADYSALSNKPQINGSTLTGNRSGADLGLQNTLTFDSTPTQDSANPVTSGGVWTHQQRQDVLQAEDRAAIIELVDGSAKNLIKLGFTAKTVGTQTSTMTADGNGIVVNGDRNSLSDIILVYDLSTNGSSMFDTRYTLPVGRYVIAPTGTSMLRIQVYCHDGGGVNNERLGQASTDEVSFEYTSALKTQYPYIAYRLWASKVSSFDNFTVYPMVCTSSAWKISTKYQPYRPSWQEMYDMILALQ